MRVKIFSPWTENLVDRAYLHALELVRDHFDAEIKSVRDKLKHGVLITTSLSMQPVNGRRRKAAAAQVKSAAPKPAKSARKLSAEAIERIRAAQQKRWAAVRKAQKAAAKQSTNKKQTAVVRAPKPAVKARAYRKGNLPRRLVRPRNGAANAVETHAPVSVTTPAESFMDLVPAAD